jgi:hypothetical protein
VSLPMGSVIPGGLPSRDFSPCPTYASRNWVRCLAGQNRPSRKENPGIPSIRDRVPVDIRYVRVRSRGADMRSTLRVVIALMTVVSAFTFPSLQASAAACSTYNNVGRGAQTNSGQLQVTHGVKIKVTIKKRDVNSSCWNVAGWDTGTFALARLRDSGGTITSHFIRVGYEEGLHGCNDATQCFTADIDAEYGTINSSGTWTASSSYRPHVINMGSGIAQFGGFVFGATCNFKLEKVVGDDDWIPSWNCGNATTWNPLPDDQGHAGFANTTYRSAFAIGDVNRRGGTATGMSQDFRYASFLSTSDIWINWTAQGCYYDDAQDWDGKPGTNSYDFDVIKASNKTCWSP